MLNRNHQQTLHAARERARYAFPAMIRLGLRDAQKELARRSKRSGQAQAGAVASFLEQDGTRFAERAEVVFRAYLDRGIETMYADFRAELKNLFALDATLVDEESMNQQIRIGNFAQRIRESNEKAISRLNKIIAVLNGSREVRERENPFRPYLLARAIYETTFELVPDRAEAKLIFEAISAALVAHLPAYYGVIRDSFKSVGIDMRLPAEPARNDNQRSRYWGAEVTGDAEADGAVESSARLRAQLERLLKILQQQSVVRSITVPPSRRARIVVPEDPKTMLRTMLDVGILGAPICQGAPGLSITEKAELLVQLQEEQQRAAKHLGGNPPRVQLEVLHQSWLSGQPNQTGFGERVAIQLISLMFAYIDANRELAPSLREEISRVQAPLMKSALLEPAIFQEDQHPARLFLNYLGSMAIAVEPTGEQVRVVADEIRQAVQHVLDNYKKQSVVFTEALSCLRALGSPASALEERSRADIGQAIEALGNAEKFSVMLVSAASQLRERLLPLDLDERIVDFVIELWPSILARADWRDKQLGVGREHPESLYTRYRDILPELIWSGQERATPEECSEMIKMLPRLAITTRDALSFAGHQPDEMMEIMDQLVTLHTEVLRGDGTWPSQEAPTLEQLQTTMAEIALDWDETDWRESMPPPAPTSLVEEMLAYFNVTAELGRVEHSSALSQTDCEFLARTFPPGALVSVGSGSETRCKARLAWVSPYRSLYLFREPAAGKLLVFSSAALREALDSGKVQPLEYAPLFDRAVEALRRGATSRPDK